MPNIVSTYLLLRLSAGSVNVKTHHICLHGIFLADTCIFLNGLLFLRDVYNISLVLSDCGGVGAALFAAW